LTIFGKKRIAKMSYLKINVDDGGKKFVEQLLNKLGYEVMEEPARKKNPGVKSPAVSPTFLFAKWKDWDIDPSTFRKKLWARKK
jgi:hypothetical protein